MSTSVRSSSFAPRSITEIQIGGHILRTWYNSVYPADCGEFLFLCEHCLEYKNNISTMHDHICPELNPPGKLIYRDPARRLAMFEVDGKKDKLYTRNLCALSKLFLDTKGVYHDTDNFLFYVRRQGAARIRLIGYPLPDRGGIYTS